MTSLARIMSRFDPATGTIEGVPVTWRRLSDVSDAFADQAACGSLIRSSDPLVYSVSTFDMHEGPGQLHCGLGVIQPGKVGGEYFQTKGHIHSRREAAEIYICLRGRGIMLMEKEDDPKPATADLLADGIVYVPGYTAHRTVNIGEEPLVYLGVYPSDAGHDYEAVRARNFRSVVILRNGHPTVLPRSEFLKTLTL